MYEDSALWLYDNRDAFPFSIVRVPQVTFRW